MRTLFQFFMSTCFVLIATSQVNAQRMVIFVRHAEKETGTGDVMLSEAGKKRADELARQLADAGVDAIYTSTATRTKQTAEPLAKQLHITPKQLSVSESPTQLKKRLAQDNGDQCVLIVGHSDTLPKFIDAIAGKNLNITIAVNQFDGLFILMAKPDKSWSLVKARY